MDAEIKEVYTREELCKDNDDGFKIVDGVLYGYVGCDCEVTVPYGVREVHSLAFKYAEGKIERINLPETVKVIRAAAFHGIKGLKYLSLCSTPEVIDEELTLYPELATELYEGISYLADEDHPYRLALRAQGGKRRLALHPDTEMLCQGCFRRLTELETVDLGCRITALSDNCFEGCTSLTELTVPESVKRIGLYAFEGCTALKSLSLPEGLEVIESGNKQILMPMAKRDGSGLYFPLGKNQRGILLEYTDTRAYLKLPDGVRAVTEYALKDCENTAEIHCPESLRSFSYNAKHFYSLTLSCEQDITVTSPPFSHEKIYNLSGYTLKSRHNKLKVRIVKGVSDDFELFYDELKLYRGDSTQVKIPSDVRKIGISAFLGRDDIKSVEFPEGLTCIKAGAFKGCSSIEGEVKLPSTLQYVEKDAFYGCKRIKKLYYPASARLAKGAFSGLGLFTVKKY